jgi:pimeloyl-ACP methyl ester carboxylesterase
MLREAMPAAEFAGIAQGGHMAPLTNPEPVNAAITRFLSRAQGGDGD